MADALPLHLVDERGGYAVWVLVCGPCDEEHTVDAVQDRREGFWPLKIEFYELGCAV